MFAVQELNDFFEKDFADFERNRMYPPDYRKDKPMTKPKVKHICSITRAQNLLETGIDVSNNPKLALAIRKDVELLCEVRDILFRMIENPTLPFTIVKVADGQPTLNEIEQEPNASF